MEDFEIILGIFCASVAAALGAGRRYRSMKRWGRISPLGRLLYGLLVAVVCLIAWGVSELYNGWYYEEAPAPYPSVEAAAADGCVVIENLGTFLAGEEHWEEFLRYSQEGLPAVIQVAKSNGTSVSVVDRLYFDGALYHYTQNTKYIHQDSVTESYPYLVFLIEEPDPEAGENYSRMESWVLSDQKDLTPEELPQMLYEPEEGSRAKRLTLYYEWLPEEKLFGP